MSIKYDKYYGVDFAIDLYLQMIKFWKTKQPGVINKTPIVILNNPIMMSRLLVSAWSSQIARTNELYLDMAESEQGIEMQKMIETKLDESELLKRIVPKQTLTSKEIKQQLKNALAHAEYTLATDENGQTIIEIDSPKISGNFTVPEVEELASIYAGDYIILDNKEYCYESSELLTFKINTKVALQNAISNIRYGKSIFDFKIPSCITLLGKMYSGEGKQLTPEEQQIVKDYIQYGGLQNWLKLSDNERGKIFSDRILRIISGRPTYRSSADIISFCLDYLIYRGKGEVSHQQFEKMSFEAPSIYADMLIDLGFLCLNHIKEAQAKQMLQDFNYQNINLKGVKYWPTSTVRIVDTEEQQRKINNQINDLLPAKRKAEEQLRKVKEQLERLDDNTKMPPEIKKQQYDRKKEELSTANTKYSSLKAKIDDLQTQHDTATDYLETNDFFRHLRNSVSHGFYSIDFSEGLKRKNLGKIVFHFEDWEIDKKDRTKRRKVFEADITADKLTSIFEELNERLINSADSFRQQEDIRYAIIDKRDPQNRDPEYQKRLENSLTKRGGIIIRP